MAAILFIKTSSLGDVIHHLPAVTEARAHRPDDRFAWVVEEAFAPLVALHPAIQEIIPVASRRWRRAPLSPATWREIAASRRRIGATQYDTVIDSQGLLRSALLVHAARGEKHGYDKASIREPVASAFYDVGHAVARDLHAIERNRLLTGRALGYTPQGGPDYGLNRVALQRDGGTRYAVLLHASAQAGKQWPVENWLALGPALERTGAELVLPWGTEAERARATELAARLSGARVADRQPLDGVARLLAGASFVVGVDTGLLHLAAALGVPLVAIFGGSRPNLTGPVGRGPIEIVGTHGAPPAVPEVAVALDAILD